MANSYQPPHEAVATLVSTLAPDMERVHDALAPAVGPVAQLFAEHPVLTNSRVQGFLRYDS